MVMRKTDENLIAVFFHCSNCLSDKPRDISPKDWSRTQTGMTPIQVWCNRFEMEVALISDLAALRKTLGI